MADGEYYKTLEEARVEAGKTGGSVGWTAGKGYYVKAGAFAATVPGKGLVSGQKKGASLFGLFPWETALGEGFIAPWSRVIETPEGYRQARPDVPELEPEEEVEEPEIPAWLESHNAMRAMVGLPPQTEEEAKKTQLEIPISETEKLAREEFEWAKAQPKGFAQPKGKVPTDLYGRKATWDTDNAEWRYPPDWNKDPETLKPGYKQPLSLYEEQQIALQQQQMAWQKDQAMMQQAEAERQYRSQLAAQPISWLQYAAYTGEEPVVQPWMQTLMPQEYQTPVGQPIPGFEGGSTGQMYGNVSGMMAGMPELTTPSAQLWSRMGPTAQQQLLGYKQARTGASPEETLWRRSQTTAPGGSFTGLRWNR